MGEATGSWYHVTPMRQQDPFIGRDILNGQFQILQKIGSGGMGSVYKALQPAMNRMVAVKILHSKLVTRKDLVSRFQREAKALAHSVQLGLQSIMIGLPVKCAATSDFNGRQGQRRLA